MCCLILSTNYCLNIEEYIPRIGCPTLSLLLFSGSEVMLSGYEEEKATVVGIDKYGYLQVLRKSGETVSLQPDGNSFDITKGLIIMKSK